MPLPQHSRTNRIQMHIVTYQTQIKIIASIGKHRFVTTREEKSVKVYGINEGEETTATLRCGLFSLTGKYPLDENNAVTLPANASTVIAEFPAAHWDNLVITTHVAFTILGNEGGEIARDCLILPLFREMKWPKSKVRSTRKGDQVLFTSDTFAWRAFPDLDGEHPLADNFFDIYPGIPTVLPWPEKIATKKSPAMRFPLTLQIDP